MCLKTFTKSQIAAISLMTAMVQLSSAAPILRNSGFETINTNFPGNAANWYGDTWAADPSSTISSTASTSAAASGNYGFLLRPHSVSGNHSAAWVGSDRSPLPGGSLKLSFQFKTISATAPNTWSDYQISFFDAFNTEITNSRISASTGYSWGNWGTKTHSNIVPPTNAVSVTVTLSAYASGAPGGDAQWAFDNVLLQSAATKTVLIDFGRDGNYRSLSAPGNWNSVDASAYWENLIDSSGTSTTLDLGFVDGAVGGVDSFNGPAGDTSETGPTGSPTFSGFNSNSVTNTIVDASALGNLAQKEAAFDYFVTSVLVINQLSPAKHYRLSFFGSHQYNTSATTIYTLYGSNPGDAANRSNAVTLSSTNLHVNDGPIDGNFWQHNKSRTAELAISNRSSVYIGFIDEDGSSSGYLNAMSIEELDIPAPTPVITSTGNGSGKVGELFTYNINADYTTSYGATGLPHGLTVNPTTGVISGTPTAAGNAVVSLIASNTDRSATNAITLNIAKGTSTITATGINTSTSTGSTGSVSYSYAGTGSTSYGPSPTEPTLPGDYEVTATVDADANWESATSSPFAFTVAQTDPLATWLAGNPTNSQTLGKYAIGGASSVSGASETPVMSSSSNTLSLTAIVRKASANANLTVGAEWATSLNNPSWSNQGVTSDTTGLTQPNDPELERRKFSVPYDPATEPRKFLRLKAVLTP